MTDPGDALASAAAALTGTRFRLHGRDPESGLDCVGLVASALAAAGYECAAPDRYALRNLHIDQAVASAALAGLCDASGPIRRGDVLLVESGPAQQHLVIAAGAERFVHAHAGLRRVVISPGPLTWPILRHWRLSQEGN